MVNLLAHVNDFSQPSQKQEFGWGMMGGSWFGGLLSLVVGDIDHISVNCSFALALAQKPK